MARRLLFVLLVLTVGCAAPPLVVPTGGQVTTGPEVEELIRKAGVSRLSALIVKSVKAGNGIWIGENRILSAAHLALASQSFLVGKFHSQATVVCKGADSTDDWAVLETFLRDPPQPCMFPIAEAVHPGQDILVVGYQATDAGTEPVAVAGTIIDPEVSRDAARDLGVVCIDLGSQKWFTLSGSAVLSTGPDGAWRLAGLLEGFLETDRGEVISVFVPVSRLQYDSTCGPLLLALGH